MIPLVDLRDLPSVENVREDPEWIATAGKVREGLGRVGFLYIVNHNIPKETIDKVFTLSRQFFELPVDVKLKYIKNTSGASSGTFDFKNYCGYSPLSGEMLHPTSKAELKETFDWLAKGIGKYPTEEFPEFYKTFQKLDTECKRLTKKLLRLLSISLKLPDVDFFLKHCRHIDDDSGNYDGLYNMRMINYPPIPDDEPIDVGTVRCGEHSDYGTLTLLFQDDVGGLEVKTVDGEWIHAKPIPGSILVNTGDLIEFWTGGIFPATPHRIIVPDAHAQNEKRRKSRYSVVFFSGPDFDAIVTPMDIEKTAVEKERLAKNGKVYSKEPVNGSEHMLGRVAKQYI